MTEHETQKQILAYLGYRRDVYFFRSGSGLIKTEQGRFFKTGRKGCPDITILFRGRFIGCEVKGEKGKQSPEQIETEKQIKFCGGEYLLARSLNDVINYLHETNSK